MSKENIKVLLIDDSETDFMITSQCLAAHKGYHFEIEWKNNYDDGLERVMANGYDICLLDYNLGEKNGADLANTARENGCTNPIILFSGINENEIEEISKTTDVEGFLSKQKISTDKIVDEISSALISERAQQHNQSHLNGQGIEHIALNNESDISQFILENLPDPVMALNKDGKVVAVNKYFCELMSLDSEDILGINATLFLNCPKETLMQAINGKSEHTFRTSSKTKGANKKQIYWKFSPINNAATPNIALIATGQIKNGILRKREKAGVIGLSSFIKNILRNPRYIKTNNIHYHSDIFE